jgi:branched-chain amino acid transport system ATP-binding protein
MPTLSVVDAQIFYDRAVEAVRDVSFDAATGQVVCFLGANGSGKNTLLKAISGIMGPQKGALTKGTISFDGRNLAGRTSEVVMRSGIVQVPEGRRLFGSPTVEENLTISGFSTSSGKRRERVELVYQRKAWQSPMSSAACTP